jgi:hypothetical protein
MANVPRQAMRTRHRKAAVKPKILNKFLVEP